MQPFKHPLRIVTITGDGPHHLCLVSLLAAKYDVIGAIIEPERERRRRLWMTMRYRSWFWMNYHNLRRSLCNLQTYRSNFFESRTNFTALGQIDFNKVRYVNDAVLVNQLKGLRPDVTIICGTSILKGETLKACGEVTINIHGGFLPYYKGNQCFFFALYDGALDKIGSTIHFVNEGVDTGDIIDIAPTRVETRDNPETLYCRSDWSAFQRLIYLLDRYSEGDPLPRRRQEDVGKTYRNKDRTPWRELMYKWRHPASPFRLG